MKQTKLIMGMPVTVEIIANKGAAQAAEDIFAHFTQIDNRYSTYKETSEISRINKGLSNEQWSDEMKHVLELCEQTKQQTMGYFNIELDGARDPSGLVKGWAIQGAAQLLKNRDIQNFYIEAGGDIQVSGLSSEEQPWKIGIRNPFNRQEIVKVVTLTQEGIATSGTYVRGQHVYNPHNPHGSLDEVKSLTVIGPNVYEADRFATAAFAMGKGGIDFIESLKGFEGYMIDADMVATYTSKFERYVAQDV